MKPPLLHPVSHEQLQRIIKHRPHGVMISGAKGSGKATTSIYLAAQLLQIQNLQTYPYFLQIMPMTTSIGIDEIRQIKAFLTNRTVGKGEIRRIIVLQEASKMTSEAQNALLKILEEPPEDTMFILTTENMHELKPTIVSRVQRLELLPLSLRAAQKALIGHKYEEQAITKAYHLSGGQPGLLLTLLDDQDNSDLLNSIATAKEYLMMNTYERLLRIDVLSKDKDSLLNLIDSFIRIAGSGLNQAAQQNNTSQAKKFATLSTQALSAKVALSKTANPKLLFTSFFLNL